MDRLRLQDAMGIFNLKLKILIPFFIFLAGILSCPIDIQAARLYLEPAQGNYSADDSLIVEVKIDSQSECINAVEANLSFDQDILEAVDFSQGNSILTLWVKEPSIDQSSGSVSFIGGIPGGYCGVIPGDPGQSNLLGKIIFKVKPAVLGQTEVIFLDNSEVLLNDGFGTQASLITEGAVFDVLANQTEAAGNQWQEEINQDGVLPEPFEIEVSRQASVFEGKYFIVFSTTDKQTGLDYYEVAELNLLERFFNWEKWQSATSPYLLEDQSLRSLVKVKAVDKAGNQRIAVIEPTFKLKWQDLIWILSILVVLGIVLSLIKLRK